MTSLRGESVCLIFKVNVSHPQNNIPSSNSVCFFLQEQAANVLKKLCCCCSFESHEHKIKSYHDFKRDQQLQIAMQLTLPALFTHTICC
jgi:hypothetical protein